MLTLFSHVDGAAQGSRRRLLFAVSGRELGPPMKVKKGKRQIESCRKRSMVFHRDPVSVLRTWVLLIDRKKRTRVTLSAGEGPTP